MHAHLPPHPSPQPRLRRLSRVLALTLAAALVPAVSLRAQDTKPSNRPDIVSLASQAGTFKTLTAAAEAAGLVEFLKGQGPITVLAPTDEAFARLPAGTLESLLKPENRERLGRILQYHVLAGSVPARSVVGLDSTKTVAGPEVKVTFTDGQLRINQARVVKTDLQARNGIIHVVDQVLLPPEQEPPTLDQAKSNSSVAKVVRRAIERGVPLYNGGDSKACTAVYEVAALSLAERPDLPGPVQQRLKEALSQVPHLKGWSDRAWTREKVSWNWTTKPVVHFAS
ncbi:MAG: fasciclin domain-containing protein [Verrucomicrobiales bacterium]|nr:fasciclin domain-containing protein [Verrucomicrobiales bacterium]